MPKTRHSFSRDRCRDRKKRKRKTDLCMGLSNWQQCFVCQSQICLRNDIIVVNRNIAYTERVGCTQAQKIIAYKSRQCEMN